MTNNKLATIGDTMKKKDIKVYGYANDKRLSIKLPTELIGLRLNQIIDYINMEMILEPSTTGNEVWANKSNTGILTFTGPKWYSKKFNIDVQMVPYTEGLPMRLKLSPPVPGAGERKVNPAKKKQPKEIKPQSPQFNGDSYDTAKQCIAYLNAYVKQNPNSFKFAVEDNHLFVLIQDRIG